VEGESVESRTFDGSFGDGIVDGTGIRDSSRHPGLNRKKLVLIVDDEEPLRVMMGLLLKKSGFKVLQAGTGHDALRICKRLRRPIDLLITDIQLPESSGFDVAATFAIARPAVPVLFISGALNEQDPELQMRISPGRDFLAKPFTPKVLETKVDNMLAASRQVRGAAGPAPFRSSVLEAC
jgi:DNA-binding response OmpR family regulator